MPDVDTSSYPKPTAPVNPLQTLSGIAGLQNTLNQNRLFQQQFKTNLAVSNIYKQAMNPDGTIDQQKLSNLLASDPDASYGLPQAYQGAQKAQGRNIANSAAALANAKAHLSAVSDYLAPMVAPKANPTSGDVVTALGHAMTVGMATPDEAANVWASIPRLPNGQIDESKVKDWAQRQMMATMSKQEQLNASAPPPKTVDMGNQTGIYSLPQMGQPSQLGTIPKGLPPTTPVFPAGGGQPQYAGAGGGAAPGGAQPGQSAAPPTFADNPPGYQEAKSAQGTFSAGQGNTLQARADQVTNNKAILGNLEGALNQIGTGPKSGWLPKGAAFFNAQTGFGFNAKNIATREEFNKQAVMLAQQQFQTLGGTGTDAKLESTSLTSPNSELSTLGNKGIIAMLKGNEDAISKKNEAWQAWQKSHGPETYGDFSTQFNKSYDPRVFQSQYLTPEDNKKMLSGMTATEKKAFANSYRSALANGWVNLPGAQ